MSLAALTVARRNAVRHAVNHRIAFVQTDLMPRSSEDPLDRLEPALRAARRRAVALTRRPRLRTTDRAVRSRRRSRGVSAAVAETRGYATLAEDTRLIVEVGCDQDGAVTALAVASGWTLKRARQDLQGITRTLVFRCEWPEEDDADDEE